MKFKRIVSFAVILLLFVSLLALTVTAENEEKPNLAVTEGCHSMDAAIPFLGRDRIVQNAKSVIMFETKSETLLYEWNPDVQLYPASLVKIMTALLVLEKGNLQDTVTVSESALRDIDVYSLSVKLQPGEQMLVEHLLYCMLVYSANDAASVLAEYISGSEADFVALMNTRASELGCTGTNYTNPHGLHNNNQLTTVRDTCRIIHVALQNETFRKIFGTTAYVVPPTNLYPKERNLSSNNLMMDSALNYYDARVTGGRAGETAEGQKNLATVSQSGNMEVVCIVMGAKSVYTDDGRILEQGGFYETSALLDKAYTGYSRRQIISANQILRQQSVTNGDSELFLASKQPFSTVLPSDITLEQLSFRYSDIEGCDQAPVQKGQTVSYLQVWYDDICIAQTEVYAMNDVPLAYQKTAELKDPESQSSPWVWIAIIAVAVAIIVVAIVIAVKMRIRARYIKEYQKWSDGKN